MFLHQREGLRGGKRSMLDRIDAGSERRPQSRSPGRCARPPSSRASELSRLRARISSSVINCWRGSSPVDAIPPDGMILIRSALRRRCSRTRRRASSGVLTMPLDQPGSESPGSSPLRGSPWPAVGPSGSSENQSRGPAILPAVMASRTATVSSPPPTSRALVKPCCSMARTKTAPSKARSRRSA